METSIFLESYIVICIVWLSMCCTYGSQPCSNSGSACRTLLPQTVKLQEHTSITFIDIYFTVITRPSRLTQTSVLRTLPGANAVVFARIRVTRVFFASFRGRKTSYFYINLQSVTQESLTTKQIKHRR